VKINPLEGLARVLMTVRTGTFTYSQNNGILLPGWDPSINVLGMDARLRRAGLRLHHG
jgi:hypothetical protein